MNLIVRDIANGREVSLELPMEEERLWEVLQKEREYVIVECNGDVLDLDEFESICDLNSFLLACVNEYDVSEETLAILSQVLSYDEVKRSVSDKKFSIVNFSNETSNWSDSEGDVYDADDKGRVLHDCGMLSFDWEKNNPIAPEMEDYIKWDQLWELAESIGWCSFLYKGVAYLVKG